VLTKGDRFTSTHLTNDRSLLVSTVIILHGRLPNRCDVTTSRTTMLQSGYDAMLSEHRTGGLCFYNITMSQYRQIKQYNHFYDHVIFTHLLLYFSTWQLQRIIILCFTCYRDKWVTDGCLAPWVICIDRGSIWASCMDSLRSGISHWTWKCDMKTSF